jgi:tetratricopeptide (TPR) repeat protein
MKFVFLSFFIFLSFNAIAGFHYSYDQSVRDIYQDIIALKLDQARAGIIKHPDQENLALTHLQSYIDFFTLFINEDIVVYDQIKSNRDVYLDKLDLGNKTSPYYQFVRAEILLQWALIDIKFDKKLRAGSAIYKAFHLLESNKMKFPYFIENNKSLSIIHVLASSLPPWVKVLLGIDGSLTEGRKEITAIKEIALQDQTYFFREEVAAINSYILFYQTNEKNLALADLKRFNLDHTKSPFIAFLKASMFLKNGDNESCLKILESSPRDSDQRPFLYLDFMMGRSKLYAMDPAAPDYLLNYVNSFKGQHFIKEAYQKLAWCALVLEKDQRKYEYYMDLCLSKGNALVDEDRQALRESEINSPPNPILLEARLLFDGGYYHQAFNFLSAHDVQTFEKESDLISYHYRLGRTLQALGRNTEALVTFSKVIDVQRSNSKHFKVGNAALQMGIIYEEMKDYKNARYYYEYCLNQDFDLYKNSIKQKAKSGVQRLDALGF